MEALRRRNLCPKLCPRRANGAQFQPTGHTFSRSLRRRDLRDGWLFRRKSAAYEKVREGTEDGSAKPPAPVQIRAAPPTSTSLDGAPRDSPSRCALAVARPTLTRCAFVPSRLPSGARSRPQARLESRFARHVLTRRRCLLPET